MLLDQLAGTGPAARNRVAMRFRAAPRFCVWELTLACNARCVHCGSSAGRARAHELDTAEALGLCDELGRLGVERVTLSGGEPVLRPDLESIAKRLAGAGVTVDLISNGLAMSPERARRLADAGVASVTLSVDGPAAIHDELRGVAGGLSRLLRAASVLQSAGLPVGAATQVCSRNLAVLDAIESCLVENGFAAWQLQLTGRLGRCRDNPELALEPSDVGRVIAFILEVQRRGAIRAYAADNIGWMLPCEPRLRSLRRPTDRFFAGCQAGLSVVGITSDGTIRGCLSMPPVLEEGNVRQRSLAELWSDPSLFAYNRAFVPELLQGRCRDCPFARVCRGGCKSLAWAATGRLDHNPFCAK